MGVALDAAAGTGKDLGTVSEAMMKAAQGNTGALGRLGIATKDASGKALTFNEVLANMATTFKGQASAAADSTAGKMANAKIQFGEFQEQIGSALLPAVGAMATFFTNTLLPAISAVTGWIESHKDLVIAALVGIGVVLGATVVPAFIAWAAAAAVAAVNTLLALAPLILIGAAVAGVAYLIISNWNTVKAVTEAVWNAILGAIHWVWNWVVQNWPILLAVITGPIGAAAYLIYRYWDQIKGGAADVWNFIRGGWDALVGFFTGIPGRIASAAAGMWHGITDAFRGAINALIDLWNRLGFDLPGIDMGPIHIGGHHIGVPQIPHLAGGGLVTSGGLAWLHPAEVVVPAPAAGRSITVNATITDGADLDLLLRRLNFAATAGRL
jgi:hypothetical protein